MMVQVLVSEGIQSNSFKQESNVQQKSQRSSHFQFIVDLEM